MSSPPSWLLSWLLNEVAECEGVRTEPPHAYLRPEKDMRPPSVALEDEDSWGGASSSGASTGGATFFCQTRIGFEFDFDLTGSSFLDLFLLLVQRFEIKPY